MPNLRRLTPAKYGILGLTLFTAAVHVALGEPVFLLNGLGYVVLLLLLILPRFDEWQKAIRWLFIGYTAVTIAGYFIVHSDGSWQMDGLGVMTKVAEVILLLLLLYDMQTPSETESETGS